MKENVDIFENVIFRSFSNMTVKSNFSAALKLANIALVFKKACTTSKENYRHVSILSNISKIYEHLLFKQISGYFEVLFSKY